MALYNLREAKSSEDILIQKFLDQHWKKNHSLAVSKELLDFQHYNNVDDRYNYIIAYNNETCEIDALFGFIPTYQYDEALRNDGDFWGAIWKKREDIAYKESKEIGMDVFLRLFDYSNFHSFSAIGISKIAMKIYKAFQCRVGYLTHYYILNDEMNDYRIAGNVVNSYKGAEKSYHTDCTWTISEIIGNELGTYFIKPIYRPYKSISYLVNRYVNHPIYKYKFYGVYKNSELLTILVARFVNVNQSIIMRVVDVLGELKGSLYEPFQTILHNTGAEYVDLMNYGIDESVFYQLGFRKLDTDGELIIPNYFEPFEQCNVKIDIAWKADYDNYVAFKGDSDQDRPNIL